MVAKGVVIAFLLVALLVNYTAFRRRFLTGPLFRNFKKVLPTMSQTEREALNAGEVWIEGNLFSGRPKWAQLSTIPAPSFSPDEQSFLDHEVNSLCGMLDDWQVSHEDLDLPSEAWQFLKEKGFFGMNIPTAYGGRGFSALAQSTIVMKIATRCISAAVTTMVPNSLGPAELLMHYGTESQKQYYLPRLAVGKEVPCFALTSLEAGSDAGALVDSGVVCHGMWEGKSVIGIRLNWDKRYITLAPVATVLGLAFRLSDPDHLLSEVVDRGITLCLIPTNTPGVEIGRRHLPLVTFMNGPTQGKEVFVPLDTVIGGASMIGHGWRMLMECLSAGRGISLPALSIATAKLSYRTTGAYAKIRKQFKISIGQFEGVEAAMARIAGYTYLMEALRLFTAAGIDLGKRPSVVSAITKYHMTEMARTVVSDAMDIHAGRGIILGPKNYLARAYQGTPVSITVEGANILTRNLIIYGQGAIRCHPYVQAEMAAAAELDEKKGLAAFDSVLWKHVFYTLSNGVRTVFHGLTAARFVCIQEKSLLKPYMKQLSRLSAALAFASDLAMLTLGGQLKRKERLSARLGDVLSHLYLATSVIQYYRWNGYNEADEPSVQWCLQRSLYECQQAFEGFCDNFPTPGLGLFLKKWIFPWGPVFKMPSDKLDHLLAQQMMKPSLFRDRLTRGCYIGEGDKDLLNSMEVALNKLYEVQPLEEKLKQAVDLKLISKEGSLGQKIEEALKAGVIVQSEYESLMEYDQLRRAALAVDDFLPETLRGN